MKVYACSEHIDEAIDSIVNEIGQAPEMKMVKTKEKCFLCGEKATYEVEKEVKNRCKWCEGSGLYQKYHDEEWGVACQDDQKQFEFLVLESAQAGLSWITILKKRENYREAYENFDVQKVAEFDSEKIEKLLKNEGIVRNIRKIEASVSNAKCFLEVQREFGSFSNYIWGFVDHKVQCHNLEEVSEMPAKTEVSEKLAKDMKKRGFKFLGPTILYAHMQSMGLVNDHVKTCFRYEEIKNEK